MFARKFRKLTAAASVLATLAAGPGQVSACCFWKSATTAYYAPAPACAPACNTCNYVPQVAYRTVYTNVPVTSYRPITSRESLHGLPDHRHAAGHGLSPAAAVGSLHDLSAGDGPCCCAAPTTVGYAPACPTCPTGGCATVLAAWQFRRHDLLRSGRHGGSGPADGSGPAGGPGRALLRQCATTTSPAPMTASCCLGRSDVRPRPSYAAGGSTTYSQATSSTVAPSIGPTTTVPSTSPATGPAMPGSQSAPSTFRQDQPADDGPGSPSFKPIPDPSAASAPRRNMIIPRKSDTDDLTVSKGMPGGGVIRTASAKVAIPASTTVDDGGWHDAR